MALSKGNMKTDMVGKTLVLRGPGGPFNLRTPHQILP